MYEFESRLREEKDKYEKVIFLDVDGVLNDDGVQCVKGVYIDEKRVERLARIVEQTGAEIVLSTSWRGMYQLFVSNNYVSDKAEIVMLHDYFNKYNLKVSGYTEYLSKGPYARPVEIRNWLLYKCSTKRFVILDDEDFWHWNWLRDYLVLTRENVEGRMMRGLEDKHVEKAIEILNKV